MFNPLKWERVDRVRLLFAAAFGALLGFASGHSNGWFNLLWALIGASGFSPLTPPAASHRPGPLKKTPHTAKPSAMEKNRRLCLRPD
jgi:hypothetical protein